MRGRARDPAWDLFEECYEEDGTVAANKVACKYCKRHLSKKRMITGLKSHFNKCPKKDVLKPEQKLLVSHTPKKYREMMNDIEWRKSMAKAIVEKEGEEEEEREPGIIKPVALPIEKVVEKLGPHPMEKIIEKVVEKHVSDSPQPDALVRTRCFANLANAFQLKLFK